MDALTPSPDPQPAPVPSPVLPTGPACTACGAVAIVHWLRRPTYAEVDEERVREGRRRMELLRLADPQRPRPEFGPLPTGDGMTRTVYACGPHAITMDAAALIHASSCTAPNDADLPGCDCTPEPVPDAPMEEEFMAPLPDHWATGGA